jgi:hypothetical protein
VLAHRFEFPTNAGFSGAEDPGVVKFPTNAGFCVLNALVAVEYPTGVGILEY